MSDKLIGIDRSDVRWSQQRRRRILGTSVDGVLRRTAILFTA